MELETVDDLPRLRGEWTELAARTRNVFSTWEWAATWWRRFGPKRVLTLVVCRDRDARAAAILPLYTSSFAGVRVARFVGHGPADQLGPVCGPVERVTAARALGRFALESHCRAVVAEELAADEGWSTLLDGRVLHREPSPTLIVGDGGWESFLDARSSHFRKKLKNQERRLARTFHVHYRLAADRDRLDDDLATLFALHRARWEGRRTAFATRDECFQRDFARTAFENGWLRLWFLELDGKPAAAWYGFRFGGVESHYQGGRDPAFDRYSPGTALLWHSIREALGDGVREYRFLRGSEAYKNRFASTLTSVETIVVSRGRAARAAAAIAAARPFARTVRRVLEA